MAPSLSESTRKGLSARSLWHKSIDGQVRNFRDLRVMYLRAKDSSLSKLQSEVKKCASTGVYAEMCLFKLPHPSRLFNAHSASEIRDKNRRPSYTVYVDNPSDEIRNLAKKLGVTLEESAEPERRELRGLCEMLVGDAPTERGGVRHAGTLGGLVLINDELLALTCAHVVNNATNLKVRLRQLDGSFKDVGVERYKTFYQKKRGEPFLDFALVKVQKGDFEHRGSISRLDFSAMGRTCDDDSSSSDYDSSIPSSEQVFSRHHDERPPSRISWSSGGSNEDSDPLDPSTLNFDDVPSCSVFMYGSETWLSAGKLISSKYEMVDGNRMLLIEPIDGEEGFATNGDSGSLVFAVVSGKVVPLGIVAQAEIEGGLCYAVRLDVCIEELDSRENSLCEWRFVRGDHISDYSDLPLPPK